MAISAVAILLSLMAPIPGALHQSQEKILRNWAGNYEILRDTATPIVKSDKAGFPEYSEKEGNLFTQNA